MLPSRKLHQLAIPYQRAIFAKMIVAASTKLRKTQSMRRDCQAPADTVDRNTRRGHLILQVNRKFARLFGNAERAPARGRPEAVAAVALRPYPRTPLLHAVHGSFVGHTAARTMVVRAGDDDGATPPAPRSTTGGTPRARRAPRLTRKPPRSIARAAERFFKPAGRRASFDRAMPPASERNEGGTG